MIFPSSDPETKRNAKHVMKLKPKTGILIETKRTTSFDAENRLENITFLPPIDIKNVSLQDWTETLSRGSHPR